MQLLKIGQLSLVSAVALTLFVGTAIAQDRPNLPGQGDQYRTPGMNQVRPGQEAAQDAIDRPMAGQNDDSKIATFLALIDREEIAMARMAIDAADSDEVRQFAERMLEEHNESLEQLRRFNPMIDGQRRQPGMDRMQPGRPGMQRDEGTPQFDRQPEGAMPGVDQPAGRPDVAAGHGRAITGGQDRPDTVAPGRFGQDRHLMQPDTRPGSPDMMGQGLGQQGQPGQMGMTQFDPIQVMVEIRETTWRAIQEEMERKQGHEFDKAYVGYQIMSHIKAIEVHRGLVSYASPELREIINESMRHVEHHLEEARELMDRLDEKATEDRREYRDYDREDRNDRQ